MTKQNNNSQANSNPADKNTAHWTLLCGIGYGIFGLGGMLISVQNFALLSLLCIIGGMVIGSIGFVGRWYHRSRIKLVPLKVALCACLILGIGGCIVDMTLPDDANFPVTAEWLVFLVGQSTNSFVLISTAGWSLFLLGLFVTNFRIK